MKIPDIQTANLVRCGCCPWPLCIPRLHCQSLNYPILACGFHKPGETPWKIYKTLRRTIDRAWNTYQEETVSGYGTHHNAEYSGSSSDYWEKTHDRRFQDVYFDEEQDESCCPRFRCHVSCTCGAGASNNIKFFTVFGNEEIGFERHLTYEANETIESLAGQPNPLFAVAVANWNDAHPDHDYLTDKAAHDLWLQRKKAHDLWEACKSAWLLFAWPEPEEPLEPRPEKFDPGPQPIPVTPEWLEQKAAYLAYVLAHTVWERQHAEWETAHAEWEDTHEAWGNENYPIPEPPDPGDEPFDPGVVGQFEFYPECWFKKTTEETAHIYETHYTEEEGYTWVEVDTTYNTQHQIYDDYVVCGANSRKIFEGSAAGEETGGQVQGTATETITDTYTDGLDKRAWWDHVISELDPELDFDDIEEKAGWSCFGNGCDTISRINPNDEPDPGFNADGYLVKSRVRFGVPKNYSTIEAPRTLWESTWDVVSASDEWWAWYDAGAAGDEPDDSLTLIEEKDWVWDGIMDSPPPENDSHQWSPWCVLEIPEEPGQVRAVNSAHICWKSTRIGYKPTTYGDQVALPEPE